MAEIALEQSPTILTPTIAQLLQAAIGSTVDQNVSSTTNQSQNQTSNQSTSGTTATTGSSTTAGSSSQNTNQQQNTTGTTNTSGSQTGTSTQVTQNNADITALQQLLAQQQAGITPQMLAAIFTEGSKAAPGLVTANANAVGARSSNNTPLATALTALSSDLTSKAAALDMQQKNAAVDTATKIAQLTSSQSTTGTNQQTSQQTQQQQQLVNLISTILGTQTQNQTSNQTQNSNQTQTGTTSGTTTENKDTNNQTDTQMNTGNISELLGMLGGAGLLNQALPNGLGGLLSTIFGPAGGLTGGVGGSPSDSTNPVSGLLNQLLPALLGGSSGGITVDPNGMGIGQIGSDVNTQAMLRLWDQALSGGGFEGWGGDVASSNSSWWQDEGWDNIDWSQIGATP